MKALHVYCKITDILKVEFCVTFLNASLSYFREASSRLTSMPVPIVRWLAQIPDDVIINRLLILVKMFTSEEVEEFEVIAHHNPNMMDCTKVIICKDQVFMAVQDQDILVLIPDNALNICKLISMWDANRWILNKLTLQNVKAVMFCNALCDSISR